MVATGSGASVRSAGLLLALAGVLLLATPAGAEPPNPYADPGPYLALGAAYGIETFDEPIFINERKIDNSWGLNAKVGYRIIDRLAAELEYEWQSKFEETDTNFPGSPSTSQAILETHTLVANAKGYLLIDQVQPYLTVGAGMMHGLGDQKGTAFAMRFGAGCDLWLSENWGINLAGAYNLPLTGVMKDYSYVSIVAGVAYKFTGF